MMYCNFQGTNSEIFKMTVDSKEKQILCKIKQMCFFSVLQFDSVITE